MATDFSKMNVKKFFDTLADILTDKYGEEYGVKFVANVEKKEASKTEDELKSVV